MKPILPLFLLLTVMAFCGCDSNVKLGGKVSFPDGSPLTTGTIFFSNDNFLARAFINPDGTFDVGSLSDKDGLPPGKYKVYIVNAVEVTGKRTVEVTGADPDVKNAPTTTEEDVLGPLIDEKYASRETTPLEIVVPGQNVYNITVEKP